MRLKQKSSGLLPFALLLLVLVSWWAWGFWLGPMAATSAFGAKTTAEFGQVGDLFGGINALFTACALAAVWWTGVLQMRMLETQQDDLKAQQHEAAQTRAVFLQQTFEATFFRQLDMLRTIASGLQFQIVRSGPAPVELSGQEAWSHYSRKCEQFLSREGDSTAEYGALPRDGYIAYINANYSRVLFEENSSVLGPYFRILYHIFKLIERQSHLAEADKIEYANLARAQLGKYELIALAVNVLSSFADEFRPLVEKFGLLKHLPTAPWREQYDRCIASTAFMSHEQRLAHWAR